MSVNGGLNQDAGPNHLAAERMQEADRLMTDLAELDWRSAADADNTLSIPMIFL